MGGDGGEVESPQFSFLFYNDMCINLLYINFNQNWTKNKDFQIYGVSTIHDTCQGGRGGDHFDNSITHEVDVV